MSEHTNRNESAVGLIAVVLAFIAIVLIAVSRMPGMAMMWDGHPMWSEGWTSWMWLWILVLLITMILIPLSIVQWMANRAEVSSTDSMLVPSDDSHVRHEIGDETPDTRPQNLTEP